MRYTAFFQCPCVPPNYPPGGMLAATPPGWTQYYCPLPRAKPGLLEDQPSRLVKLIDIIVTWQYRPYRKIRNVLLGDS